MQIAQVLQIIIQIRILHVKNYRKQSKHLTLSNLSGSPLLASKLYMQISLVWRHTASAATKAKSNMHIPTAVYMRVQKQLYICKYWLDFYEKKTS